MSDMDFYYKGFREEERFFPYTPTESIARARGSWYELWFDVLKSSPWYREMEEGKEPRSVAAAECFEKFGDLRKVGFERWWLSRGYEIFAEKIRYSPPVAHEVTTKKTIVFSKKSNEPPKLMLEIPLNVHPSKLEEEIRLLLRQHSECHYVMSNRWENSTAEMHLDHDMHTDMASIREWLKVFKLNELGHYTQDQICQKLNLHPYLFKDLPWPSIVEDKKIRQEAANVTSDRLKKIRRLMAHATEGRFPLLAEHAWATSTKRTKRKSQ